MIQRISIAGVATFDPTHPQELDDLKKINYIFGSNGTGKTTISRVMANPDLSPNCQCIWDHDQQLKTLVLNRDFVEDTLVQRLRGVFTLGENAKDIEEKLQAAKEKQAEASENRNTLIRSLEGGDGTGGKKGELATLESDYRNKFWVPIERIKKEGKLDGALTGVRNDKEKCKKKILDEAEHNKAVLKDLADLERRAETIFGEPPEKQTAYPTIDDSSLLGHESDPILKKKVIGKEDVNIAEMITKLGNSDWVREGLLYYKQSDGICPFCQQDTTEEFAQSLKDYFDEAFEQDTKAIATLISRYTSDADTIQSALDRIIAAPSKFIDVEKMKTEKAALDKTIEANTLRLENKRKEPSKVVTLDPVEAALAEIKAMIDAANAEVEKHNKMVDNLEAEKQTLTAEVWRYVLDDLKVDLVQYRAKKDDIDKAIKGLGNSIKQCEMQIAAMRQEIQGLEKQTTSIRPTINAINNTLKKFGFDSFTIDEAGNGNDYKLRRANGEDAKRTLSEGEKTFVVFLYFYHLISGSFSESGLAEDCIIVFDDPVSSLDSDVLFIVSSLIREVCERCRQGDSHIKQVFVFTHNVYFHKEVTYEKRTSGKCLKDETFWIVRKSNQHSQCIRRDHNPIKTSYGLLWEEVREAEKALRVGGTPNTRIENTLRRILEHYFSILGSIDYRKVCENFEGQDKVICNSLFSWVNAGSHSAFDDAHITQGYSMIENALRVFKEIFKQTGHSAHYEMMNPPPVNGGNTGNLETTPNE